VLCVYVSVCARRVYACQCVCVLCVYVSVCVCNYKLLLCQSKDACSWYAHNVYSICGACVCVHVFYVCICMCVCPYVGANVCVYVCVRV